MIVNEMLAAIQKAKQQNPQFDFGHFTVKCNGLDITKMSIDQDFVINLIAPLDEEDKQLELPL